MTNHDNVVIPGHIVVKRLPARVAQGAYKPRIAARGDGPSFFGAARSTADIAAQGDRRATLARAALKNWR